MNLLYVGVNHVYRETNMRAGIVVDTTTEMGQDMTLGIDPLDEVCVCHINWT